MSRVPSQLFFEVIIEAIVEVCNVKLLGLKTRAIGSAYFIGDSRYSYDIPDVV